MFEGLEKLEVPRHRHPRARRVFRAGLVGIVVLSLFFGAGVFVVYKKVNANLGQGIDRTIKVIEQKLPKGPLNILVLGSDRRDVIEGDARQERQYRGGSGQRADTIILLHLAAGGKQAVLVSFPRDLRVSIPGHGYNKINTAYTFGGANLMIQTVMRLSGLDINHYVEVNFASFRSIVNAVGGVSIYVNRPMVDKRAGLDMPKPGCYDLNGDESLAFVRARHVDPTADLGRIERQQLFLRVLMRKVKSVGFILNFKRVLDLSEAVGKGLRYDKGVDLGLARAIASRLSRFDQRGVDFRKVPGEGRYIGGISYVLPSMTKARALFNAIERDAPLPPYGKTKESVPDPSDVSLQVFNGSGRPGLASREASRLRKLGFEVRDTGNAKTSDKTVIVFSPDAELKAALVKKQYPGSSARVATQQIPADVIVILGKDALTRPSPSAKTKPADDERPLLDTSCK